MPPPITAAALRARYANPALRVTPAHTLEPGDAPIEDPGPGQALVHVKATGICGSDIHFWRTGAIGSLQVRSPCILGHEASGVVLAVAADVTGLAPGDRVAIEPGVPCGTCFLCASGRYNLCEAVRFAGVWPHDGTLRRFMLHPAKWLHKIPPTLPHTPAALLEPLSVILHALRLCPLHLGTPVLISGAGPIGLLALAAARASGAHPLVITDVSEARLAAARALVPHCRTYRVKEGEGPRDVARGVRALFRQSNGNGNGTGTGTATPPPPPPDPDTDTDPHEPHAPPTILECTGLAPAIAASSFAVRRGGRIALIGVGQAALPSLPFMHLSLAETQLIFVNRYHGTWPAGIAAFDAAVIDPLRIERVLVSHVFPLERAREAVETAGDPAKGAVKAVVLDEGDVWAEMNVE